MITDGSMTTDGQMITIGVDAHKAVHVAVAVSATGRVLREWRGPNTDAGWAAMQAWAAALVAPAVGVAGASATAAVRQWGIEGSGGYGRNLAQALVVAGEVVYEVSPRLTAAGRRRARQRGKTDGLDAQAVARAVLREGTALPRVQVEDDTSVLALLTQERDSAVAEATRVRNQIHALLHQIDPEYATHLPTLTTGAGIAALLCYAPPAARDTALNRDRAAVVRRLAARLQLAESQAAEVAAQIRRRVKASFAPLLTLHGVSGVTAGALAGLLGSGQRWTRDAQLAAYAGVAPLAVSSAGVERHRLNRGGNRQLNKLVTRIALTQARDDPRAQAYLARRVAEGKSQREALRALKRYIIRAIFRLWQQCTPAPLPTILPDSPAQAATAA